MAGLLRTYASDGDSDAGRWLLFVQQQHGGAGGAAAFALKALVSLEAGRHVLAELLVGEQELSDQIDALGLEIEADAFAALLSRALDDCQCVNLVVGDNSDAGSHALATVTAMVTYKFSETISRKGCFELPVVATDVSAAVVDLLTDVHAFPHRPVLSNEQLEHQKLLQKEQQHLTASVEMAAAVAIDAILKGKAGKSPATGSSQSQELEEEAPKPSEQRLKRKQIPTGTIRRKAAKGAKLLKR